MYRINFNEKQGLLELTLSGFWTLEIVNAFQKDAASVVMKYSKRFPNFGILSDSRELALMSTEVSEAFGEGSREFARQHRGRFAIIVKSSLSKMQAKRVTGDQEPRLFTEVGEAREWLLSDERNTAGGGQ
jgi:hypothetical protein